MTSNTQENESRPGLESGAAIDTTNKEIVPMKLEFKNPPTDARVSNGEMAQVAEALRANPGEWALIGRKSPSTSAVIKKGLNRAFRPAGSFEAVTRGTDGRTADIYARYVGEAS